MESTIFVSYARQDQEFALKLAEDLRAGGVNLWIDQLDIRPGEIWDVKVAEALDRCGKFLVVLSPRSVARSEVQNEISYALEKERVVIPVICEPCDIPFRLRRVQNVDCATDYQKGLARLLREFATPTEPIIDPDPLPGPRTDTGRGGSSLSRFSLTIGMIAVLIAGVVYVAVFIGRSRTTDAAIPPSAGKSRISDDWIQILAVSPSPHTRLKTEDTLLSFRLRYNLQSRDQAMLALSIAQDDDDNGARPCTGHNGHLVDHNTVGMTRGEHEVTLDVTWHGGRFKEDALVGSFKPSFSLWEWDLRQNKRFDNIEVTGPCFSFGAP